MRHGTGWWICTVLRLAGAGRAIPRQERERKQVRFGTEDGERGQLSDRKAAFGLTNVSNAFGKVGGKAS